MLLNGKSLAWCSILVVKIISIEEITEAWCIITQNIEELKVLPNEDIKEYILR